LNAAIFASSNLSVATTTQVTAVQFYCFFLSHHAVT
jgi:hypothetical protein